MATNQIVWVLVIPDRSPYVFQTQEQAVASMTITYHGLDNPPQIVHQSRYRTIWDNGAIASQTELKNNSMHL
jgi:hypothetical protein